MIVDCMDCHAAHAARNDRESGFFTQDSRACEAIKDLSRKAESTSEKNNAKRSIK